MRRISTVLPWLVLCVTLTIVNPSSAEAQANTLRIEPVGPSPVVALPSANFSARVLLDATEVLTGWSYSVCSDPLLVMPLATTDGSTTATVNNGAAPAFIQTAVEANGFNSGVVINLLGMATLPVGTDYELRLVDYMFTGDFPAPAAGDPDIISPVEFCNDVGTPPVDTVVVNTSGASITPDTVGFDIIIPAPAECDFMCVSGVDNVAITWNNCNPGGPADYYMLFRGGVLLNVFDDGTQAYDDLGLAPGQYHYELLAVSFPDPNGPPSILQGSCTVDVIPVTLATIDPVLGLYQGGTAITVTGTGFQAALDTTFTIGGQTALDIVIVDDNTLTCTAPPVDFIGVVDVELSNSFGSDLIVDAYTYGFERGFVSEDLKMDIADPIFLLSYLFSGGPAPFCMDAADMNDDGDLDIGDSIFFLNFLFMGGPQPPAPYTEPGFDPTPDDLDCGNPPPGP